MSVLNRILSRFRRRSGPQSVKGHNGATIRVGMHVRSFHYDKDAPKLVVRVFPKTNGAELDFGDGVRDRVPADLYVPARVRGARRED